MGHSCTAGMQRVERQAMELRASGRKRSWIDRHGSNRLSSDRLAATRGAAGLNQKRREGYARGNTRQQLRMRVIADPEAFASVQPQQRRRDQGRSANRRPKVQQQTGQLLRTAGHGLADAVPAAVVRAGSGTRRVAWVLRSLRITGTATVGAAIGPRTRFTSVLARATQPRSAIEWAEQDPDNHATVDRRAHHERANPDGKNGPSAFYAAPASPATSGTVCSAGFIRSAPVIPKFVVPASAGRPPSSPSS